MLKSPATVAAVRRPSFDTPVAYTASASASVSSSGRNVCFSMKPSAARSRSLTGAVRQSALTAFQTSSPSAYDATAPWQLSQNKH